VELIRIPASDGFSLSASLFRPAGTPRRIVVINSATGVRRGYYEPFARYLAARGHAVVSYDYRGIGDSRPERLTGFRARMRDWGERDLAGVIDFIDRTFPRTAGASPPLAVVGHSVGGQIVGLAPNNQRIGALLAIAAQSGEWRLWPAPARYRMAVLWYGLVPLVANVVGYLPGSLGIGQDLPRGVALEWARWCRTRGYLIGDVAARQAGYSRYAGALCAYSLDGDDYAPPEAVDRLAAMYDRTRPTRRHLADRQLGHFGFFKERYQTLWDDAATWLEAA
jgi:predicted alpha/beta hydrolase